MNEQPTALRLADAMQHYFDERRPDVEAVAAELRRQHDRINTVEAALRLALEALERGETKLRYEAITAVKQALGEA